MNDPYQEFEEWRREILFRKFTIRKCSNHWKVPKHNRHVTMDYFEPHKKLIKAMQKEERKHQELSAKHQAMMKANDKLTHMPDVKLARHEKKWTALARKLKWLMG